MGEKLAGGKAYYISESSIQFFFSSCLNEIIFIHAMLMIKFIQLYTVYSQLPQIKPIVWRSPHSEEDGMFIQLLGAGTSSCPEEDEGEPLKIRTRSEGHLIFIGSV